MSENNFINCIKLDILINEARVILCDMFCKAWENVYNEKWVNDNKFRNELRKGFGIDICKRIGKYQNFCLESGDIRTFDIITLHYVIKEFDMKYKSHSVISSKTRFKIEEIVATKNKISIHPTKMFTNYEFEVHWKKLSDALLYLGYSQSQLNNILNTNNLQEITLTESKEVNSKVMKQIEEIKINAMIADNENNYTKAVELFTESLQIPDLSESILSDLHLSRAKTYSFLGILKSYEKSSLSTKYVQYARYDIKHSINYKPNNWDTYRALGYIYQILRKYEKAILNYKKVLSFIPEFDLVKNAILMCELNMVSVHRCDYVEPRKLPWSKEKSIDRINKLSGLNISLDKSNKNLMKLRKSGDSKLIALADVHLAYYYLIGIDNISISYENAANLFAKAAAAGNAEAIYNLAMLTKSGKGVKRDPSMAITLLRKAANSPPKLHGGIVNVGVAEAQFALGICYEDGIEVDANYVVAKNWYERSCKNGNSSAATNLGLLYFYGRIGDRNIERTIHYWKLGAEDGNSVAIRSLEIYYSNIGNVKQAQHWCQASVQYGNISAVRRNQLYERQHFSLELEESLRFASNVEVRENEFMAHPNISKLRQNAAMGSITAKNLVDSCHHFMYAMNLYSEEMADDLFKDMINELAESYRIEKIVPSIKPNVKKVIQTRINCFFPILLQKLPDTFERDLRICHLSFNEHSLNEMYSFCIQSIERFPDETYFYDMQQFILFCRGQYDRSLKCADFGLRKFPNNINFLYNKAITTYLYKRDDKEALLNAYMEFLNFAPKDHRKVPDVYYAMAACHTDNPEKFEEFMNIALESEKLQLHCFLPYQSKAKVAMEKLKEVRANYGKFVEKNGNTVPQTLTTGQLNLVNQHRFQLCIAQRENIMVMHTKQILNNKTSTKLKKLKKTLNLPDFKKITFRNMDLTEDHLYEGFALDVQLIEDAFIGQYVELIFMDNNQDVQRCVILHMNQYYSADEISKRLKFGAKLRILNPYLRIAPDLKSVIRVDDPKLLVFDLNSKIDNGKFCRFCMNANGELKLCARCKHVWYCSKQCQQNDWKILKHKNICTNNDMSKCL